MQFDHSLGSIHYGLREITGSRPIIFLHSALGSSLEMETIRSHFSDRTGISIDLPAHGQSTATEEITTEKLGELLAELLDHLDLTNVDLIGYSLGGYVALELAAMRPDLARSVATHAMKWYWTAEAIERSVTAISLEAINSNPKFRAALESVHEQGVKVASRAVQELMRDFERRQLTVAEIHRSKVPVLISTGDGDELVPPEEALRLFNELGPEQAELMILPNTRHPIKTVEAEWFVKQAKRFQSTVAQNSHSHEANTIV